jgi:E3 ubiquitin-protein ligase UBR7
MTDDSITASEYLENQERLEQEASEILPGKFEKCSFPLGYVRQSLYACKTCGDDQAGICYSCSIACHSDHELFELFPKRDFRCDCGMEGKLNGHACSLMLPAKRIVKKNDKNKYNHNFQGLYCR